MIIHDKSFPRAISFCLNRAKQCIFEINGDLESAIYTEIQCLHDELKFKG